jgi:hypothetical protein
MFRLIRSLRRRGGNAGLHALAIFDPAVARYQKLRAAVVAPDYTVNVLADRRVIYIDVPKAAGTTIKLMLSESLHGSFPQDPLKVHDRSFSGIPSIRDVGIRKFFDLVDDPNTFIFTFVRNPYARIVSCYRDKFQPYPIGFAGGCNRDAQKFFQGRLATLDRSKPLPFQWFVEMACATSRDTRNGHWLAMDRLVPKHDVVCRFVGRVEEFSESIEILCDRLGSRPPQRAANAMGPTRLADWISPSARDTVRLAYREDFERFGYSAIVPA